MRHRWIGRRRALTAITVATATVAASLGVGATPVGAGTTTVIDVLPGIHGSRPEDLRRVGDRLFFNARDDHRTGSFISDGGAKKTRRIHHSSSGRPVRYDDFFVLRIDTSGGEPHRTDGSASGTEMIKDIAPGGFDSIKGWRWHGSNPRGFIRFKGLVYFTAADGIWKTDGTEAGTHEVTTIPCSTTTLVKSDGHLYFACRAALWRSDGTASGTVLVRDIWDGGGVAGEDAWIGQLTPIHDQLFFRARDKAHGRELWVSDGTSNGTHMVKNLDRSSGRRDGPTGLIAFKGELFFSQLDRSGKHGLWRSDGTKSGTRKVSGGFLAPTKEMTRVGGILYFVAEKANGKGRELWRTDGSTNGTGIVRDIRRGTKSSNPNSLARLGSTVYFVAGTPDGRAVFQTRGSSATTTRVKGIPIHSRVPVRPKGLAAANGSIYFSGNAGNIGRELYRYAP